MTWWATGAAVVTSVGGGMMGAKAAKEAGKATSNAIMTTYKQEKRGTEAANLRNNSLTDLSIAASNIQKTGTAQVYYDEMVGEQKRQLDWMKKVANANAKAARSGGQAAGQAAIYGGIAQGAQAFGSGMAQSTAAAPTPTPASSGTRKTIG
jgi:hypothetical protein